MRAYLQQNVSIKLTQIHCHRPSEAEYLRDLPLEVRVGPGAPPQPRVELRRPVRAAGPVAPQDDRVPPDVQVAEVLPWGYKLELETKVYPKVRNHREGHY